MIIAERAFHSHPGCPADHRGDVMGHRGEVLGTGTDTLRTAELASHGQTEKFFEVCSRTHMRAKKAAPARPDPTIRKLSGGEGIGS